MDRKIEFVIYGCGCEERYCEEGTPPLCQEHGKRVVGFSTWPPEITEEESTNILEAIVRSKIKYAMKRR